MRLGYKRVVYPALSPRPFPTAPTLLTLVMGHAALEIFVCPTENTLEKNHKESSAARRRWRRRRSRSTKETLDWAHYLCINMRGSDLFDCAKANEGVQGGVDSLSGTSAQ